jgi:hypothetical protein
VCSAAKRAASIPSFGQPVAAGFVMRLLDEPLAGSRQATP